jgi:uncharacterized protein (TIGR03435 family)
MRTFAFLLLPAIAVGQTQKTPLRFEVCDIQVSRISAPGLLKAEFLPGGRGDVRGMPLKTMIAAVNRLSEEMVTGPAWMAAVRYDIAAKAAPNSNEDELFEMVRSMLQERFQMVAHTEEKVMAVYALVVGKKGLAMTARTGPRAADPDAPRDGDCSAAPGPMVRLAGSIPRMAPNYFEGMPVVDRAGAKGVFDFKIDWMGGALYKAALTNAKGGTSGEMPVSIFDAVESSG